jgi:crotonobetainyl-CoA:carnitine CoA-transferase CaiB-like acyl-CoA transferase
VGPLSSLRVIEIGDRGEAAGKLLADAGAGVIKVEPRDGVRSRHAGPYPGDHPDTNASLTYAFWNTNKRGVTLDVASPEGLAVWRRLVATVDVVVDASGPGVMDGRGGGRDAFAADERLIWCSITPFGIDGPWRDFQANDLVSVALGGPMMSSGYEDHDLPPMRPDGLPSLAVAGEYAVMGILTAMLQRRATGRGQLIDISIHDTVSATTEGAFANWEYFGRISQRQTGRHAGPTSAPTPRWQIECSDGNHVVLIGAGMPRDERVWANLMAWMAESGADAALDGMQFKDVPRDGEGRQRVLEVIHAFVASQTAEQVYRRAQECHLPWGYVRRPEQNLDDPHWHDRGFFIEAEVPGYGGKAFYPGAPYRFSATPLEFRRRAPLLGEHNFEVFVNELGYTSDELVALARAGVI